LRDFAVVVASRRHRQKLPELASRLSLYSGEICTRRSSITLLSSESIPSSLGAQAFAGIGFADGQLLTSLAETAQYLRTHDELCLHGLYACVRLLRTGLVVVESDVFGMAPLYHYQAARRHVVSNRLHLLVEVARELGWSLTLSHQAMLTRLFPVHFGQQLSTRQVYFREIQLLAPRERCVIRGMKVEVEAIPAPTFERYEDAIQHGFSSIRKLLRQICDRHQVFLRLSGGWDSRVLYGALLREELLDSVYCWTLPSKTDDFRVVCGLVERFGGRFSDSPVWLRSTHPQDLMIAFTRYRSYHLGCYSANLGFETHCRAGFGPDTVCVLFGGGGECFRTLYLHDLPADATARNVETRIREVLSNVPPLEASAARLARIFRKNLLAISGHDVHESLRQHYIYFRNRFHYGISTQSITNRVNMQPLLHESLLEACRLAGPEAIANGRIHFDLHALGHEDLPHLPFESPKKRFSDAVAAQSRFGRIAPRDPSFHPDEEHYQVIRLRLAVSKSLYRTQDKNQLWKRSFAQAYGHVRSHRWFRNLYTDAFHDYIDSLEQESPQRYYQWTASVIGTSDLLSIAESR